MSCSRTRSLTSSGLSAIMAPPSCSTRLSIPPRVLGRSMRLAKVAVAAGDGDDRSGRIDPWPGQHAFVDGALQAERGTAKVADGGEAAHQRGGGLGPREERGIADVASKHDRGREPHHRRVPMRVGQAGHQGPAAAVDDPGGRAAIDGDRRLGNSFDQVAANQHVGRFGQGRALAVEDSDIVEERHGRGALLGACGACRENEHAGQESPTPNRGKTRKSFNPPIRAEKSDADRISHLRRKED